MILQDHAFEVSVNTRAPRSCAKCGRIPEWHPVGDPVRQPAAEVEIKAGAAALANVEASDLITFSQTRARPGPVQDSRTRDFGLDTAEELADAANYLTWWLQALADRDGDWGELQASVSAALVTLIGAWHALRIARVTEDELAGSHPHRKVAA